MSEQLKHFAHAAYKANDAINLVFHEVKAKADAKVRKVAAPINAALDSKLAQMTAWGLTVEGTIASLISATPSRQALPLSIRESIGSFGIPAILILTSGLVGKHIETTGKHYENEKLETTGRRAYHWMWAFIAGLNTGVEMGWFPRNIGLFVNESAPDMAMGFLGIACATVAARSLRQVVKNKSQEIRQWFTDHDPRAIDS